MNIRRLFRWLEQVSDESLYDVARRCTEHLDGFSVSNTDRRGLAFVLGGMVGPLAVLRVQESDCSSEQANRVVALAMEGAARVGVAYAFHPRKDIFVSLCEDLIARTLLDGRKLEDVAGCVEPLFSCIPKEDSFSSAWFQEIRSAVDAIAQSDKRGSVELSESCLSIEPLYHQQRFLCETLICAPYTIRFEQLTAALALESILSRHIKAAGKRLRADQIQSLEIELLSGLMDDSLKEHLAAQMVFHPDPIAPRSDWSPKQKGDIEKLTCVIQIEECDWGKHWSMEYQALGRLYMTATKKERESWVVRRGQLSWFQFLWMERAIKNSIAIEEYSFLFPVSLRLHTTRGGCWKEKLERLYIED